MEDVRLSRRFCTFVRTECVGCCFSPWIVGTLLAIDYTEEDKDAYKALELPVYTFSDMRERQSEDGTVEEHKEANWIHTKRIEEARDGEGSW